jgi:CopG family transcriptional regulator/antitoxin EndoAI
MPRKSSVLSISPRPDLASDLDSVAGKEQRSRSELVREAVRQYVLRARWRSPREKAVLKTIGQGSKEKDIERLVGEERSACRR